MTKAELIAYLKRIYNLVCNLEGAQMGKEAREQEYRDMGKRYVIPKRQIGCGPLIGCICLFVFSLLVFILVGKILREASFSLGEALQNPKVLFIRFLEVAPGVLMGLAGIVGIFCIRYFCLKDVDKEIEEARKKNEYMDCMQKTYSAQKLDEIEKAKREVERYRQALQQYRNQGILHENYFARKPLVYIIGYLEEGRADNLKEALNLYSDEIHKENMAAAQHAYFEEELEIRRQTQAEVEQLRRDIAEGQAQAQREATVNGIIAAIGTDNAIRARKEIERANGKIV